MLPSLCSMRFTPSEAEYAQLMIAKSIAKLREIRADYRSCDASRRFSRS